MKRVCRDLSLPGQPSVLVDIHHKLFITIDRVGWTAAETVALVDERILNEQAEAAGGRPLRLHLRRINDRASNQKRQLTPRDRLMVAPDSSRAVRAPMDCFKSFRLWNCAPA